MPNALWWNGCMMHNPLCHFISYSGSWFYMHNYYGSIKPGLMPVLRTKPIKGETYTLAGLQQVLCLSHCHRSFMYVLCLKKIGINDCVFELLLGEDQGSPRYTKYTVQPSSPVWHPSRWGLWIFPFCAGTANQGGGGGIQVPNGYLLPNAKI